MGKVYGVVLIGCGHIGQEHIENIYYRENIKIVGVVDFVRERAELFSRKYSCGQPVLYDTDYKEMIKRDDVDIVIIATYVNTHLQILKDCLAAGKHILCEKPIASNVEEGEEFYNLVKNSKQKVLIAHILRHNDTYIKAAELIHSGVIGDIRLMRMVQNHHIMNRERYASLLNDCSPIVDCGVHYIDVVKWFSGCDIVSVNGMGSVVNKENVPEGGFDYGLIAMRLSNGGMAYYEAGWTNSTASQNLKEFVGTKGRIRLILRDFRDDHKEEGDLLELYNDETKEYSFININAQYKNMNKQIQTLIDMIENDTEGFPTIDDAFKAFCIALEADKRIREGLNMSLGSQKVSE